MSQSWHNPHQRSPHVSDLSRALEQIRRCTEGHRSCLIPREASALLARYEALDDTLKAIVREGDPCTATRGWSDPMLFAEWAVEQARSALQQDPDKVEGRFDEI